MDWLSQLRWRARWTGFYLRWLGYCLAAALLTAFSGLCWLSPLPDRVKWILLPVVMGTFVLIVAWSAWRSAPDELLRSVDREFAGRLASIRDVPAGGNSEEPSWNDAFTGMFCGPVLAALLTGVLFAIAEKLGYSPPSDRAFGFNLLLGAWLGLFSWIHLGARLTVRETGRWMLGSGLVSLAVIAWVVVLHSRAGDGAWSRAHFWGTLFILVVPLLWSVLHLIQGMLAHLGGFSGGRRPGDAGGPDPGDWDGGTGRPAPTLPVAPRRSSGYAESRPEHVTIR